MKFYPYWARAEAEAPSGKRKGWPVACWRWSDLSLAEAEARARAAVERLAERLGRGEPFPDHYGYSDHPVREPVLERVTDDRGELIAAVTRNGAGCLVLNTARVMFVDIDLPQPEPPGFFARLFGKKPLPDDHYETAALQRVATWAESTPTAALRVYRTRAGLRLLLTDRLFDPASEETASIMQALDADPLYRKLCLAQQSFRARLTPKPWRIGQWPLGQRLPYPDETRVRKWADAYAAKSDAYAVCNLVREHGRSAPHPEAARVIELHDRLTRLDSNLPLA